MYMAQKLIWLFDENCLFSVNSFLVKKIEIRLNFDSEKLRACSTSRNLKAPNFTSVSKDEPRISAAYFPATETQQPKSHRDNLKQRFAQTSVISAGLTCGSVKAQQRWWGWLSGPSSVETKHTFLCSHCGVSVASPAEPKSQQAPSCPTAAGLQHPRGIPPACLCPWGDPRVIHIKLIFQSTGVHMNSAMHTSSTELRWDH